MTMTDRQRERVAAARRAGMDVMYAENSGKRYETWTYSDGQRVAMRPFYTLEGLQGYATHHCFAIVYVD